MSGRHLKHALWLQMVFKHSGKITSRSCLVTGIIVLNTFLSIQCDSSSFPTRSWTPPPIPAIANSDGLKIVTFNAWHGLITDEGVFKLSEYESAETREVRYQQIISELQLLDPDLVALQEANPLPGYAERISRDLGYDEMHQIANGGIKLFGWGIPSNVRHIKTPITRI